MIPVVGEWIAAHPGTISLGQGIVHYAPPDSVTQQVVQSLRTDAGLHRYGLVRGIDPLLERMEQKLIAENQLDLRERTVICTAGSNMGFLHAILAIADVDDEIILLSPYYFNHEMAIEIAGCRPVLVATDADYQIELAALEAAITPRTRAIVTVSPNNPTGAVYPAATLAAVNQLCRSRNLYHISDEAYEYFIYGNTAHFSPASLADSQPYTISLYTLSKAYGMAGWRMGYMVTPQHLENAVKKIQDTNLVCPPIANQIAATAALREGKAWCASRIDGFAAVRNLVLGELAALGNRCRVPQPDGAFYALMQLDTQQTDIQLVKALIRDHGVAVMPGCTFGAEDQCSLRIAYGALDNDTVAEGMGRLVTGLHKLL